MPKRILNAFFLCKSKGFDFELIIIGRQGFNLSQKVYLGNTQKKLNKALLDW